MNPPVTINALLETTPHLWRGRATGRSQCSRASGHSQLDEQLPGGGWPIGAVTELITARPGLGELCLLFPALAAISHAGQWLILIDPPWIPYPAAFHGHGISLDHLLLVRTDNAKSASSCPAPARGSESLWACEQALRNGHGGAVLAWPEQISFARLRRLQLAAEAGNKLAFLFRPRDALKAASPSALRLHLHTGERGTRIDVLKCRGQRCSKPAWIPHLRAVEPFSSVPCIT